MKERHVRRLPQRTAVRGLGFGELAGVVLDDTCQRRHFRWRALMLITKFYKNLERRSWLISAAQGLGDQQRNVCVVRKFLGGQAVMFQSEIGITGPHEMIRDLKPRL